MAKKGKKPSPKSQREISRSHQEPYINPETGQSLGNPNVNEDFNRGEQVSFRDDNTKPFSLGFKEIDEAIFYYIEKIIKPTVIQNGKSTPVPVVYGSAERWKQIQKDGVYKDVNGKILMPIMVFKRNNIEKVRNITNKLDANNPHNAQVFSKKYSSKNAYDNFDILNNRIPEKQQYAVVMPDYVNITYDFIVSTYYVEQMNKLIEAINYASDSYWGDPESFKFKASIDSFSTPIEMSEGGERSVKCLFSLKLYGYVIPDTIQKDLTSLKKFNSKSKVLITMETVPDINNTPSPSRFEIASPRNFTVFNYPQYPSIIYGNNGVSGVFMTTGSISGDVLTFSKSDNSTFNITIPTGSASINTGSFMITGSVSSNVLTFTKGDGSIFDLTVDTGSAETINTGSFMKTGSVSSNVLTFTKGNGSTFNLTTPPPLSISDQTLTGNRVINTSVHNIYFEPEPENGTFRARNYTQIYLSTQTSSSQNSFILNDGYADFNNSYGVRFPQFENYFGNALTYATGYPYQSIGKDTRLKFSPEYSAEDFVPLFRDLDQVFISASIAGTELTFHKFNTSGSSLILPGGGSIDTGSFMKTGSVSSNVLTFTKGDGSIFDLTVDTGSFTQVSTASLLKTGSVVNNVLTFEKGDGSTFNLTVDTGSGGGSIDTGSFMKTGSVSSNVLTFEKGDGSTFNLTVDTGSGGAVATIPLEFACSDFVSVLYPLTSVSYKRMPFAGTITGVRASLLTAATGATFIVNIKKNGTTIFSTNLTIDSGQKTSVTAATPYVLSSSTFSNDDEMTVDIVQVGSTTSGRGLIVTLLVTET